MVVEGEILQQEEEKKQVVEASQSVRKANNRKNKKAEAYAAKEEDLNGIYHFTEPVRVKDLWNEEDPA